MVSLQDLVEFHNLEYKIISGVYFAKRNYTIQKVISDMFNLRLKLKAEGNPAQNIVKLMLNSSYGKTIETVHDTESHIKTKDELHPFVLKHFASIVNDFLIIYNLMMAKTKKSTNS